LNRRRTSHHWCQLVANCFGVIADFKPGQRIEDYLSYFVYASADTSGQPVLP
jgi:hypothetical protein